jgi:hypothetical protein
MYGRRQIKHQSQLIPQKEENQEKAVSFCFPPSNVNIDIFQLYQGKVWAQVHMRVELK